MNQSRYKKSVVYRIFFLFTLVGEKRKYGVWSEEPECQWVLSCEPILKGNKFLIPLKFPSQLQADRVLWNSASLSKV